MNYITILSEPEFVGCLGNQNFLTYGAPLIKSEQYRHRRSTNEQSTVSRLQLARSWVVRTMSSSEKCVSGSIRSLGVLARGRAKNLSCREMIVDSRGLLLVRSYNSI